MSFDFEPHDGAHRWSPRRYQPIIAKEWAYSVLWNEEVGGWQVAIRSGGQEVTTYWSWPRTPAETASVARVVDRVNLSKLRNSGKRGGAFRITEYGQVIVPSKAGGAVSAACVGAVSEALPFVDPWSDEIFDLSESGHSVGDPWQHPVVAFRYGALADGRVCFISHPEPYVKERQETATHAAAGLRPVRKDPDGGFTFHVNDQGVAVQKDEAGRNPVFIGAIARSSWFAEEACE